MTSYHVQCGIRVYGTIRPYWAERDGHADGLEATIIDIATAQLESVLRVIRVDLEYGEAEDVSEEMALDVINRLDDIPRGEGLQNFLDTHAPEAYREFCVERDAAWGRAVARLEAAE